MEERQFGELPQGLVEAILTKCENIGQKLIGNFEGLRKSKNQIRERLKADGLLKNKASLKYQSIPTCCGVDGSYAVEKLLSSDIVASAAVAIEGLTPPAEIRFWDGPNYESFVETIHHDVNSMPRGIMMSMELNIAFHAPHDIVMLDGSFTTPLIHMNQAVNSINTYSNDILSNEIRTRFNDFIKHYLSIASSTRTDKAWIYLPKYTTNQELHIKYSTIWPSGYDDRAALTQCLEPGEFVGPLSVKPPESDWHLRNPTSSNNNDISKLINALKNIQVVYYKPNLQLPALRIEMSKPVAGNEGLLAKILQCLEFQCGCGGVIEPYPLYMADRMVKSLSSAIPTFRQAATLQIAKAYSGDISDVFFGMHGYRTESGRN